MQQASVENAVAVIDSFLNNLAPPEFAGGCLQRQVHGGTLRKRHINNLLRHSSKALLILNRIEEESGYVPKITELVMLAEFQEALQKLDDKAAALKPVLLDRLVSWCRNQGKKNK